MSLLQGEQDLFTHARDIRLGGCRESSLGMSLGGRYCSCLVQVLLHCVEHMRTVAFRVFPDPPGDLAADPPQRTW